MKIVFTLLPQYIELERIMKPRTEGWKREFEEIVNKTCDKYNCLFWNYKNREEISSNRRFYSDVRHLNTIGGTAITSILNQDLKKYHIC